MFKNKKEEFIFTIITSGMMIYVMGVYNVAIHNGGLQYKTFLYALMSFPLEWVIGFIFAYCIAGRISKTLAFKVVIPEDRRLVKILCIQTFTVCVMVPLMSMLGTIESAGITFDFIVIWIQTVVLNFIVAYPLQIFLIGPFCRKLFQVLFKNKEPKDIDKELIKL